MPLKDEFSSDLSDIDLNDYADNKQQEEKPEHKLIPRRPKHKKIIKSYRWKFLWVRIVVMQVKQSNIVSGSSPLWVKKWIKVKYTAEEEAIEVNGEQQKDKGALELAHAIILEQMNNN